MKKVFLFMLFINKSLVLAGRHFFGYFPMFYIYGLLTKNAWSVFEHALHGPKGESQGRLSLKKVTRHKGETSEIKFPLSLSIARIDLNLSTTQVSQYIPGINR